MSLYKLYMDIGKTSRVINSLDNGISDINHIMKDKDDRIVVESTEEPK